MKLSCYRLNGRSEKKIFHANGNQNRAGVVIVTPEKIDFKSKIVIGDKESFINDERVNSARKCKN